MDNEKGRHESRPFSLSGQKNTGTMYVMPVLKWYDLSVRLR